MVWVISLMMFSPAAFVVSAGSQEAGTSPKKAKSDQRTMVGKKVPCLVTPSAMSWSL